MRNSSLLRRFRFGFVLSGLLIAAALPADTFTVTTTGDSGAGSLRQAILNANATAGTDTIRFSIGSGARTISPLSALPTITEAVVIDGTTQPGFSGPPIIELSGASAGMGANGLRISSGGCLITGLVINRFQSA